LLNICTRYRHTGNILELGMPSNTGLHWLNEYGTTSSRQKRKFQCHNQDFIFTMSILNSLLHDPTILPVGTTILMCHISLFLMFKYVCPKGPWKDLPSFTAHQVIALILMVYQTYLGFQSYQFRGMLRINEGGLYMSRFTIGVR
jgi:hypothetical protein